jgi:hypothetical protein
LNYKTSYPFSAKDILIAIAIWSLLILRFGYYFGTGDHVELLPYTLFLNDNSLYPNDFFIQSLHANQPNERTVFAHLLLPFVNHLEITMLLLHLINAIVLLLGLFALAKRFIANQLFAWLAVFVSILVFNDKALGNVDLYTPSIQAGDVACAIIVWAINLFLDRKYLLTSLLMSIATLIHVLEGLDVMILLCLLVLIMLLRNQLKLKTAIYFYFIYFIIAFPLLFMVLMAKSAATATISNDDLFAILFEFRHPHHFIFSSFPLFNKLFFLTLVIAALIFFRKRNEQLFQFVAFGVSFLLTYIVCTDYLHIISVANFQWYKVTQWIKFIGIVAAIGLIVKYTPERFQIADKIQIVSALVAIIASWLLIFSGKSPLKVQYQIANLKYEQPEIDIAIKAKNASPKGAVFVIPFNMSEFKYWSQRSAYVEFKANVRNKLFVGEWYKRIGKVYGIDITDTHSGFEKHWPADDFFYKKANSDAATEWQMLGITHIVSKEKLNNEILTPIDSNDKYFIYKFK